MILLLSPLQSIQGLFPEVKTNSSGNLLCISNPNPQYGISSYSAGDTESGQTDSSNPLTLYSEMPQSGTAFTSSILFNMPRMCFESISSTMSSLKCPSLLKDSDGMQQLSLLTSPYPLENSSGTQSVHFCTTLVGPAFWRLTGKTLPHPGVWTGFPNMSGQ